MLGAELLKVDAAKAPPLVLRRAALPKWTTQRATRAGSGGVLRRSTQS